MSYIGGMSRHKTLSPTSHLRSSQTTAGTQVGFRTYANVDSKPNFSIVDVRNVGTLTESMIFGPPSTSENGEEQPLKD